MRLAINAALLLHAGCSVANAASSVAFGLDERGYSYGMAEDASALAAEQKALSTCQTKATNPGTASRCKIAATLPKGCVAVAAGPTWAAWGGGSQQLAEKTALDACNGHSKSCSVVATTCTKDVPLASTSQTQIVEGRGFRFTGMNMRGDRGFVGDKRMYNSILLEFIPADYKVKTVDLSGPFALEGAANELGVYQFCIKGHGVLVYDSSGPRHIDYTCTLPDQICIAGSCRKNIRGPTAITSETSFIRNGDEFHLKGKATAAYSIADSQRSISLTELIDFSIAKDGTCSLINYRKESHSEEHYVTESPYNHPDPPSTIVTQSEAGASCDIFKNPMGQ